MCSFLQIIISDKDRLRNLYFKIITMFEKKVAICIGRRLQATVSRIFLDNLYISLFNMGGKNVYV